MKNMKSLMAIAVVAVCAAPMFFWFNNNKIKDSYLDSRVEFIESDFRFSVQPSQVVRVVRVDDHKYVVDLSIDRVKFGAADPLGPPRVTCSQETGCTDTCAAVDGIPPSCPDIKNGWYRVKIIPTGLAWGSDPEEVNRGPRPGFGFKCADVNFPGLELCWDPRRITPIEQISNVRDVEYAALKEAAAYTWVSKSLGSDGSPAFVASCAASTCFRTIFLNSARIDVSFHVSELSEWQRFDSGLHRFMEHFIKPAER